MSRRVAVVTGGSRGIGRAVALGLARDGFDVGVLYAANEEAAASAVAAVHDAGTDAVAVRADVSVVAEIGAGFEAVEQRFGGIDVVVHAAAVSLFAPHSMVTEEQFDTIVDTNFKGTFFVLAEAARRVRDGGRIVAFSTGGTQLAFPAAGLYSATKAAGERLVAALSKELGARAITVNSVAPGVTETDGLVMDEQSIASLVAQTPLGRLGRPDDVAAVVRFLCSDAGGWVNGQRINANGGIL